MEIEGEPPLRPLIEHIRDTKNVNVFKRDKTDRGAACFAFLCEHHRLRLSIASVRRELQAIARVLTVNIPGADIKLNLSSFSIRL